MEICTIGLGSLLPFLIYITNKTKHAETHRTRRFWGGESHRQVLGLIQIDGENGGRRGIVCLTGQVLVLLDHLGEEEHDSMLALCKWLCEDEDQRRFGSHLAQSFSGGEQREPLQPQVDAARRDILQVEPLSARRISKGVYISRKNGMTLQISDYR